MASSWPRFAPTPRARCRTTHLDAHGVNVQLLVEIIKQAHSLHDHRVDLVGRELELVAAERVRETEAHGAQVARVQRARRRGALAGAEREQRRQVRADAAIELQHGRVGHDGDAELLCDGAACEKGGSVW
jgi:hypothetical protein